MRARPQGGAVSVVPYEIFSFSPDRRKRLCPDRRENGGCYHPYAITDNVYESAGFQILAGLELGILGTQIREFTYARRKLKTLTMIVFNSHVLSIDTDSPLTLQFGGTRNVG